MALNNGAEYGQFSGGFIGVRRYLFEVLPQHFPWGRLTRIEMALWGRFAEMRKNSNG
jgi:hypothetical protein